MTSTAPTSALPVDARIRDAVARVLPDGIRVRASDRLAYAHDASHYLLTPALVATPTTVEEVARLLVAGTRDRIPLTFRSGGTSLSGQASTDGVLVDTRRSFRGIEILDEGARVRVQPGATVGQVNARLAPFGFKLGPDPASEAACTIGGVVANNSSGMACGTEFNSYRTVESLVLVLPSGTMLDTGASDADHRLAGLEPTLHLGLQMLRDRIRAAATSVMEIERQFALKNTMGYALNSFLDYERPIDILTHLMVGSEGTLGFVAEVTFRTVPLRPHVATGFLVFEDLDRATDVLPELVASGLAAIELLDQTSLRVAQQDPLAPDELRRVGVENHAALLVEYQELTATALQSRVDSAGDLLRELPLAAPAELTDSASTRAGLWHIRKGLYATVAGNRPSGTTALLEDIAVPVPLLAGTCGELIRLFDRHGYEESVIFGHAKDGNIHFLLNERFDRPESLVRYSAFTDDMVDLVLGNGGTLKAEHGTGRIMAPFVRRQYGDELYDVMREIKRLVDPAGILNPGVLVNDEDDQVHLRNLKLTPTVESEVDRCVECGYCEPVCPSRDLTLTPRQRIALRRDLAAARASRNGPLVRELEQEYRYDGIQTCAVDGMCQTACPVLIDTGALVKRLRAEQSTPVQDALWGFASNHWSTVSGGIAKALDVADHVAPSWLDTASSAARRIAPAGVIPQWDEGLPIGGPARVPRRAVRPAAAFFPACVGSMFGAEQGDGAQAAFLALCERAGVQIRVPDGINSLCCGTPWKSKGMTSGFQRMHESLVPWMWEATQRGALPVVCDAASCTEGLMGVVDEVTDAYGGPVEVMDAVAFVAREVLPRLAITRRLSSLALHPTCSSTRMGINGDLRVLAGAIADDVVIPSEWGCCAFAGDRGLLHPELTASATAAEAASVRSREFDAYASVNRTCEIGMSRATARPYRHILELLAEATR